MDDGSFPARRDAGTYALIVAVLLHDFRVFDVRVGRIQVDGTDANRVLEALLNTMIYDVVMLSGISFGGFNLVDIKRLARKTGKPVIAVIGQKPNSKAVRVALRRHFEDWKLRWGIVKNAGSLYGCKSLPTEPRLCFEVRGASPGFARRIIAASCFISRLPEPVRAAGILARGLTSVLG